MAIGGNSGHVIQTEPGDQILHCHWGKFWADDTDESRLSPFLWLYLLKMIKYSNQNIIRACLHLGTSGLSYFSDSVFADYDLFKTLIHIPYHIFIGFGIILTHFYINFSRQEHQIDVLYVSFKTWDSQVSAYTPFHFSFTVPLRTV